MALTERELEVQRQEMPREMSAWAGWQDVAVDLETSKKPISLAF